MTRLTLVLLLSGVLAGCAVDLSQKSFHEPPGASGPGGQAQCIVKISCTPDLFPLDAKAVDSLLGSPAVVAKAAEEVFGAGVSARVTFTPLGGTVSVPDSMARSLVGRLGVDLPPGKAAQGEEYLVVVCRRLRQVLTEAHERAVQGLRDELRETEERLRPAEGTIIALQTKRDALCAEVGVPDLSRQAILDQTRALSRQREETAMTFEMQTSRLNALRRSIAEMAEKLREAGRDDPVAAELERIIGLREQEVIRLKGAPAGDLLAAQTALAEAKVRLAERKEAARQAGGASLLEKLNHESITLSIDAAEAQTLLKTIAERLEILTGEKVRGATVHYEMEIRPQLDSAMLARVDLATVRDRLKRRLELARPPTVTILGADEPLPPTTGPSGG